MAGSNGTKLGMVAALVLGAACGSAGLGSGSGSASASSGSTHAGTGGTTSHAASVAEAVAVGVGGAGGVAGSGGSAPVCDPPAAAGSFYAQSAPQYGNPAPTSMCDYRGDVLLVVNTAAI
jgi:hypothetical protein